MSGQIEVTIDDEKHVLAPRKAYVFDSKLLYRFRNVGSGPCELISACTPPTF